MACFNEATGNAGTSWMFALGFVGGVSIPLVGNILDKWKDSL